MPQNPVPMITISRNDLNLQGGPGSVGQNQIEALFNAAYLVAGIVAVIMIIIGGIRYATANGDSGQIQSAKNTILYSVVGLVVIIMAAAITQFVIQRTSGGL